MNKAIKVSPQSKEQDSRNNNNTYNNHDYSNHHILHSLNKTQLKAVLNFDKPLLILAGAGTGKTNTITKKIAYIIDSQIAKASQILAVTFTNKAANEMKQRIESLIADGKFVNIGTFHSICLKILRSHYTLVGLKSGFTIIDAQDQKDILKEITKDLGICNKTYPIKNLLSLISKAKENQSKSLQGSDFVPESFSLIPLNDLFYRYHKELDSMNSIDFDDILIKTIDLFEQNKEILKKYQDQYKYIMIDEYQDTNKIQYKLIKYLAENNKNICVVGDDDQSIYSWRGADVSNILRFNKDYKDSIVIKLEQNYRSTQNVLEVANIVIKNNTQRLGKELFSNKLDNTPILVRQYLDERNEVTFIINQIQNLVRNGLKFSNIAILLRSAALSRYLEESFLRKSIPYKIVGGLRFYERREIKDLLSYLKLLDNPFDFISFKRALQSPKRGLGDASILKIKNYASAMEMNLIDVLNSFTESEEELFERSIRKVPNELKLGQKLIQSLEEFFIQYSQWTTIIESEKVRLDSLLEQIISDINYNEFLRIETEDSKEFEQKQDNIREFLRLLSNFSSLSEFLEHITLAMETEEGEESRQDSVSIMTIHASKGLEFEAVFLPFMEDGIFPNQRVLNEMKNEQGLEEERRLCYVAITRAIKYLYITFSKNRFFAGSLIPAIKSRFVEEILSVKSSAVDIFEQEFSAVFAPKRVDDSNDEYGFNAIKKQKNSGYTPSAKRAVSLKNELNKKISIGAKVKHKIFGIGIVGKVDGIFLEVSFDSNDKKMIRKDFLELI